jgi:hypothetical protein
MLSNKKLIQATKDKDIIAMQEALDQGALVSCRDVGGLTALHLSVIEWHEEGVELLLNAGAKVDEKDSRGQTPLHIAVAAGAESLVLKLLQRRASIDIYNIAGLQPIHLAVTAGYREIIKLLLIEGAELTSETGDKKTSIELAASLGQSELVTWLKEQSSQIRQLRLEAELKQEERIEQLEEDDVDHKYIIQEKTKENVVLREQIESMQRQIATFKSLLKEKFTFKPKPSKDKTEAVAESESQADSEQLVENASDLGETIQAQAEAITQLKEGIQQRDAAIEELQAALIGPTAPSVAESSPIIPPESKTDDSTITAERAKALATRIIEGAIDGLGLTAKTPRLTGVYNGGRLNSTKKVKLHRVLTNRIQSSKIELTSAEKKAELVYGLSVCLQDHLEHAQRRGGFRIGDTNHIHCTIPADEIEYSVALREEIDEIINRVMSGERLVAPPPNFSVFGQQQRTEEEAHVYTQKGFSGPSL